MSLARLHDDGWASHGDRDNWVDPLNPVKQRFAIRAMADLGNPASILLLDFGCGNGAMTEFFASAGYRAEGLDVSNTIIERNRVRLPHIPFHLAATDQPVPLDAGTFDVVFSSEVIEHVYDVQSVFSEFSRLLRPGGLLIVTTPFHGLVKNLITAAFYFDTHFDPTWQHIRFWTRRSLTRVSESHSLTPVSWRGIGRLWPVHKSFFVVFRNQRVAVDSGRAGG